MNHPTGIEPSDGSASAAERTRERLLDEARGLQVAQARAEAGLIEVVVRAVDNAVAHPEIELIAADPKATDADYAARSAVLGLSLELAVSQDQVRALLDEGRVLTKLLPATWAAFRSGAVTHQKTRVILKHFRTLPVDEEIQLYFDRVMAEAAAVVNVNRLGRKASRLAQRLTDRPLEVVHAEAAKARRVWVDIEEGTGMAYFTAYLHADEALLAKGRLDAIAKTLDDSGRPEAERRTADQKRADVTADILIGKGEPSQARPRVNVYVPLMNLAHCPEEVKPASINGVVPISAERARELVGASPTLTRIFTDPVDGAVLGVGRKKYLPSADLKRFVLARDELCGTPGCMRPGDECDLDHRIDFARGGETSAENLTPRCPKDHTVKHATRWQVDTRETAAGATEVWTSPGGRRYWDRSLDPPPRPKRRKYDVLPDEAPF
ncbi:HNH endonuclease signature motif containing protein [Gryllotalpicola daejeonensis]|uniref:HNH endonuclease signature motif containing protein n=1 Tax=Gryllotalpicola daejeonensis TaxID=993087 RepID=A0ABP7ZI03_9MICO